MHSLPVFIRMKDQPVIVVGKGDAADAKRRLVQRAGGKASENPDIAARYAFVATDDIAEARMVAARLKARGILVNVADQPALCDFTLPAIVDRNPVIIAIGTGGASAALAKSLRQRFETLLPGRLGALASALHTARGAIAARWSAPDRRRRALDAALVEGGLLDPMQENSVDHLEGWLAGAVPPAIGGVYPVHLGTNDPDDLTVRTARLLGEADEIWYMPQVCEAILHRGRADAKRVASESPPPGEKAQGGRVILWLTIA